MKLTASAVAKIAGAVAAAVASAAAGAGIAHRDHGEQLAELISTVNGIQSDVRLLKCAAKFPGDCPGQAAHGR